MFGEVSILVLGSTQSCIHLVPGAIFPSVKEVRVYIHTYECTYISFRRSTNSVVQQSDMKLVKKKSDCLTQQVHRLRISGTPPPLLHMSSCHA